MNVILIVFAQSLQLYICFPVCASCVFKLWRAQALEDEAISHQPSNITKTYILVSD